MIVIIVPGLLIVGNAGTGKTCVSRAVAEAVREDHRVQACKTN
jgi:Cdc6-like AAA superfamily ATPase